MAFQFQKLDFTALWSSRLASQLVSIGSRAALSSSDATLPPTGMFIYAFTQDVHWIASCIALVVIIVGIYAIFSAVYK